MTDARSFGRALDTNPEASEKQIACWRSMSDAQKADLVASLTRATRQLAQAGIRSRHPDASSREQFLRLAILELGRDLAREAYSDAAHLMP